MVQAPAPVSSADRLSFTLFLAVAIHATVIFGIGFAPERPGEGTRTLDVTLAHHQSDTTPEDADFIAQANQEGSGDQSDKAELTTTELTDFADQQIERVQLQAPSVIERSERVPQQLVITTQGLSDWQVNAAPEQPDTPQNLPQAETESLDALSQEIASLQARLDNQRQAYAKRPRIHRLTSVSTKAHYEALYIDAFRRDVEEAGTRNFPRQALARQTFGNVRLMVALNADGSVRDVEVLQSSGHGFLDQAAVQSVRLAAPFAPFTREMREKADILEIIRTWRFDPDQIVTSH
ncbi:MAG: energy transducer TonB [Alcanivorax sp.]|nr:energy transducer TonB [Alcanivorax sp.]